VKLILSLIEGLMGLKKEYSILQLFLLYEGFLIESRYRAGYPFNKVLPKLDNMRKALS